MKSGMRALAVGLTLALGPGTGSAGVIGFLGNFDVINDTGKTAHGFEIDLESLHASDITDVFGGPGRGFPTGRGFDPLNSVERYGSPSMVEYTNGSLFGTKVTYKGLFDGVNWDFGTPSGTFITPGDNCWSGGGVGYGPDTPCDHFGVGTSANPTKTTYNWLLETDPHSGVLTNNGLVNLPAPVVSNPVRVPVGAPPGAPAVPLVVMEIKAPAPAGFDFGDALWVKVFTTELGDHPGLEDLIAGQPAVDLALGNTEIEWQLLQVENGNANSGKLENETPEGGGESVVRRYEFFKYTGDYDQETHEARLVLGDTQPNICDLGNPAYDPTNVFCDPSGVEEVGNYLGAQNAAANVGVAAAPEPGTWAMLLAGLSMLGFMFRRRRMG